ncbi:Thioredoxin F-type [Nymphaea thermarum]|nr:Thioredoxin F-type [Nymphaea thermarum]
MAMQISISSPSSMSSSQIVSSGVRMFCRDRLRGWRSGEFGFARLSRKCGSGRGRGPAVSVSVSASLEVAGAVAVVGQVTEVNKDTFWPIVNAAEGKVVVLDMYTQWCGPCKVIAPKFQDLSEKYLDVLFLKLDCNQENKASDIFHSLAKELGIRVVPTFKILKDGKVAKEVTGAKFDDLVAAIDAVRSS